MFDASVDIDWTWLTPLHNFRTPDAEEMSEILALADRADVYLRRFTWCMGIGDGQPGIEGGRWYGDGIPSKVGVFLYQAILKEGWQGLDQWTWLIVGDLPPARISPWYARNQYQALERYVAEMDAWVKAVRSGESVHGLIPLNVDPTPEYADMLTKRLELLQELLIEPNKRLLKAPVAADREKPPLCKPPEEPNP